MSDSNNTYKLKIQGYSVKQLLDIEQSIDRKKYPERYKIVVERLSSLSSDKKSKNKNTLKQEIEYAGFLNRFFANLIDSSIMSAFFIPIYYLLEMNQHYLFGLMFISFITIPLYFIYFHTKSGATPGKSIIGLKVVKLDFTDITLKNSILRSSGDILFSIMNLIWLAIIIGNYSSNELIASEKFTYNDFITLFGSLYFVAIRFMERIWFWSEVAFVLTNSKKRAIHDFIAGTVVVVENTLPPSSLTKFKR